MGDWKFIASQAIEIVDVIRKLVAEFVKALLGLMNQIVKECLDGCRVILAILRESGTERHISARLILEIE
jgi:hypothetical protein